MLVSLSKNKWLYDWMKDQWPDEIIPLFHEAAGINFPYIPNTKPLHQNLAIILSSKGHEAKATKNGKDLLVSIPDEEYTFMLIKYC